MRLTGAFKDAAVHSFAKSLVKKEQLWNEPVDIRRSVETLQTKFRLVDDEQVGALVCDVSLAFEYQKHKKLDAINAIPYAKFKASDYFNLESDLANDLAKFASPAK